MSNIDLSNARLVGLWLQLFATGTFLGLATSLLWAYILLVRDLGAYFVYLAQCVEVLRGKRRDGMSLWLPIVCALMFVITMIVCLQDASGLILHSLATDGRVRHGAGI